MTEVPRLDAERKTEPYDPGDLGAVYELRVLDGPGGAGGLVRVEHLAQTGVADRVGGDGETVLTRSNLQ